METVCCASNRGFESPPFRINQSFLWKAMSYQVLARKWRPQNFDEVIFQDHVSGILRNSIKLGRISHAYIFSGPRGVGKTTMARILAKALNCLEGPTPTPCGKCENCLEIKGGGSFDVIEIDGASNNGVDNIRELRENVNFSPVKSKYKIYIIDEVHMVTTQAFNALLKTLEEPPPHVIFIFATTEINKVPDTILSRCQKYFFKKIPIEEVVNHLKSIVEKEGYDISSEALYPVARISEGSMRDAQSLLEQVIAFSKTGDSESNTISEEDALSILGMVSMESYVRLINFLVSGDDLAIFKEVRSIVSMGIEIPGYVSGLMDTIRAIRLIKKGIDLSEILGLSPKEVDALKDMGKLMEDEELSRVFSILTELSGNLRFSGNEEIHLEMALLDIVSALKSPSLAAIIKKLEERGTVSNEVNSAVPEERTPPTKKMERPAPTGQPQTPVEKLSTEGGWKMFLKDLESQRKSLGPVLRAADVQCGDFKLVISFPPGSNVAELGKKLDDSSIKFIENSLSSICGRNVSVSAELGETSGEVGKTPTEKTAPSREGEAEAGENMAVSSTMEKVKDAFFGEVINKGE